VRNIDVNVVGRRRRVGSAAFDVSEISTNCGFRIRACHSRGLLSMVMMVIVASLLIIAMVAGVVFALVGLVPVES